MRLLRALSEWWTRLRGRVSPAPRPRGGAPTPAARLGLWGEKLAARYLAAHGYRIVERRRREGRGELDLVAVGRDAAGEFMVFVEVKTRSSEAYGGPVAALDRRKRQALRRSALRYLRHLRGPTPRFRFDLVAIVGSPDSPAAPSVRHIPDILRLSPRVHAAWLRKWT